MMLYILMLPIIIWGSMFTDSLDGGEPNRRQHEPKRNLHLNTRRQR